MQPFSPGLKKWCKDHPDFTKALKIIYPERFITFQAISTSSTATYPNDEIIGVYAVDYGIKKPRYKQDFIVNIGRNDDNFILYTSKQSGLQVKYIKHINDFFATYGKDGSYTDTHWPTFDQLPDELKPRAEITMKLAQKLKIIGLKNITKDDINRVYDKLRDLNGAESHWL